MNKKIPFVLRKREVDQLVNVIKNSRANTDGRIRRRNRDLCIIRLMSDCGLRVGEVVNLLIENINLKDREVYVKFTENWKPKVGKERTVPIPKSSELLKLIPTVKNRRRKGYLIVSKKNNHFKAITTRNVQDIIKKYLKLADLSMKAHCHTLRHSYASYLAAMGVPLDVIRDLLGHTDLSTTGIYLHTQVEQRKEQVDKIDF